METHIFKKAIDQASVVSFDIFDTLVYRPFVRPVDLFLQIEHDLNLPGFFDERIWAEMKMRKEIIESGKDIEITYDEIYTEISETFKHVQAIEIDYELRYCLPNPEMIEIYQYAVEQKKRIVISSDMYLPLQTIKRILENAQVNTYEHIYLSSDSKISKVDGSTYSLIKKTYNDVTPSLILHIGDNHHTDYLNAHKASISAMHYVNIHESFKKNSLISQDAFDTMAANNDLGFSKYYGFLAVEFAKNPPLKTIEAIAAQFVLPIVLSFNASLLEYCYKNKIKKIFFASRDGYIFKESFDQCFEDSQIKTEKLYVSRRACVLPSMEFDSPGDISIWAQGMEGATPLKLWENLEIENDALKTAFINFANGGDKSTHQGVMNIYAAFFNEYGYAIKKNYKPEAETFYNYLSSIGYFEKDIVVVELGWSGSLQNALHKIGSQRGETVFPHWFYLATREETHNRIKRDSYGYLVQNGAPKLMQDSIRDGVDYIELLFSAPVAGIKSLNGQDKNYSPVYFDLDKEEEKRISISLDIFNVNSALAKKYQNIHGLFNLPIQQKSLQVLLQDYIKNIAAHSQGLFANIKVAANFQNKTYKSFTTLGNKEIIS